MNEETKARIVGAIETHKKMTAEFESRGAETIAAMARRRDLPVCVRSRIGDRPAGPPSKIDVLVLDSVGELPDLYREATVVFVGNKHPDG